MDTYICIHLWKTLDARAVCACVQVVRDINRLKLDPSGEPVEALLTRDLKHRSMMKTLAHAWWMATDRGGAGGGAAVLDASGVL